MNDPSCPRLTFLFHFISQDIYCNKMTKERLTLKVTKVEQDLSFISNRYESFFNKEFS